MDCCIPISDIIQQQHLQSASCHQLLAKASAVFDVWPSVASDGLELVIIVFKTMYVSLIVMI